MKFFDFVAGFFFGILITLIFVTAIVAHKHQSQQTIVKPTTHFAYYTATDDR